MAHPTTARPASDATMLATFNRVIRLLQETAVHNDWCEMARDWESVINAVRRAVVSTKRVGSETAARWRQDGGEVSSTH